MKGYVHSTESFGTVDGPGIRFVVFLQGCPMRCLFCHNPDTQEMNVGNMMSTDEIITAFEKNRTFYKNGGITVTGGEPLMQIPFVTELFEKAKQKQIHTCIDTSGLIRFPLPDKNHTAELNKLIAVTDLIMLDIKHIDPKEHLKLTGQPNDGILAFAKYLSTKPLDLWIRHVIVPTITDNEDYLYKLGYFIGELPNLKGLDLLPYHTLGKVKYEKLGREYPLDNLPPMDKSKLPKLRKIVLNGFNIRRTEFANTKHI